MPHKQLIDTRIATEFLGRSFAPEETIAIVLRRTSPTTNVQRIVTLQHALQPRYLSWLAHENATGANVYIGANPLVAGSRKRTKENVAGVRHLYLDLDADAEAKLAALRPSNAVPIPTAIVSTSRGKYQALWRVESIPLEQQERLLKLLALTFGGDPACADCNRVLRLPGFLNQKYDPEHQVTVVYPSELTVQSQDSRLANPVSNPEPIRGSIRPVQPAGKRSHSEADWAWILGELARGRDPIKLTRTPAERRSDKPDPVYYTQRTVDVASAWLWLRDGIPITDIVTMLQARRRFQIPDNPCSARAHEIAFTAQRMIARKKIA
jgi:hypothetical protein